MVFLLIQDFPSCAAKAAPCLRVCSIVRMGLVGERALFEWDRDLRGVTCPFQGRSACRKRAVQENSMGWRWEAGGVHLNRKMEVEKVLPPGGREMDKRGVGSFPTTWLRS